MLGRRRDRGRNESRARDCGSPGGVATDTPVGPPRPPWETFRGGRVSRATTPAFCKTGGSYGARASVGAIGSASYPAAAPIRRSLRQRVLNGTVAWGLNESERPTARAERMNKAPMGVRTELFRFRPSRAFQSVIVDLVDETSDFLDAIIEKLLRRQAWHPAAW